MSDKLLAEWFWTDRWMGSSGFLLPMEARGLYREMLTQAWRRGGRLPNDPEAIQRATGATAAEWRRAWPLVQRHWRVDGDALVNDTQLEVYAEAQGVSMRAAERGRRGGLASAHARHKPRASSTQVQPDASTQLQPERQPPTPSPTPTVRKEHEQDPGARARSNGNATKPAQNPTDFSDDENTRAGRFVERYAELHEKFRHGARYISKPTLDYVEALQLVRIWDDARLDRLAEAFLTTDDEWVSSGSRTLARFRSRASWCDERLRERGL